MYCKFVDWFLSHIHLDELTVQRGKSLFLIVSDSFVKSCIFVKLSYYCQSAKKTNFRACPLGKLTLHEVIMWY